MQDLHPAPQPGHCTDSFLPGPHQTYPVPHPPRQQWPTLTRTGTSTHTAWAFWRNKTAERSWLDSYTLPTPRQTNCSAQNLPATASRTPPRVLPFGLLPLQLCELCLGLDQLGSKASLEGIALKVTFCLSVSLQPLPHTQPTVWIV